MTSYFERIAQASVVFTPGAPISSQDCFSGRQDQLRRVIEAIPAPGRHPIIFGQRGVGKTSLANVICQMFSKGSATRVSCVGGDTFRSIWDRVLRDASVAFKRKAWGFSDEQVEEKFRLIDFLGSDVDMVGAPEVAKVLGLTKPFTVFILDEFDKVSDQKTREGSADLIKILSDTTPQVTIVTVGVAGSVEELVGQHPSIERNLVQIELPRMSDDEIKGIVTTGWDTLHLQYDSDIPDEVAELCGGFPHYAHLLGYSAAKASVLKEASGIDGNLFQIACDLAIDDAIEKYRDAYTHATTTSKPSRYPHVLCACAYAEHDEKGIFRATDVVDAMRQVFNERVTVPQLVPALGAFCSPGRDQVLTAVLVAGRNRYAFADPMMKPFLRIKTSQLLQAP